MHRLHVVGHCYFLNEGGMTGSLMQTKQMLLSWMMA